MMARSWKTISITYEIHAQEYEDGRFTVPKQICDLLGLKPLDDINLVVQDVSGQPILDGI